MSSYNNSIDKEGSIKTNEISSDDNNMNNIEIEDVSTILRNRTNPNPTKERSSTIDSTNSSIISDSSYSSSIISTNSLSSTTADGQPKKRRSKKKIRKNNTKKSLLNVAPLNTPLNHRLETLGVVWHCISIPFFICVFLICISLGWVVWVSVIIPYFIWWYGFDLHTPTNGKASYRVRNSIKNLIIWEWFVNYFPIKVYKTVELPPTFEQVLIDDEYVNLNSKDEEDLVSENSKTLLDNIFKVLGLKKRLNKSDEIISVNDNKQSIAELREEEEEEEAEEEENSPSGNITQKKTIIDQDNDENSSITKIETYKTVSTGPRYLFGYHPHGVISMGVVGLFGTNALRNEPYEPVNKWLKPFFHDPSKYKRLFPGIGKIFTLTLTTQFTIPFYRDYLMSLGISSASAKNIKSLISNGDNSVCLVIGGAHEALLNSSVGKNSRVGYGYKKDDSNPEEEQPISSSDSESDSDRFEGIPAKESPKKEVRLVLNNRKGFIKLAIELGNVNLVPLFAFGEADVYKLNFPKPGSFGANFQQWMKKNFKFTIPFFSARGVFIYDFGFLPFRNPINIVVGKPIHVPEGCLQEYKLKHPEEFEDASKIEEKPPMKKTNSFTDFIKLSKSKEKPSEVKGNGTAANSSQHKRSSVRTKIPQELLDKYHKLYVDELKRVYEENKEKFGYGDVELKIID
ncbi:DGA1 [Candida jiufengensis]|uniref:DGA1 n=1 Tax=Candida jiufengensis TaxID=497108 RepID=UPI002224CD54|nr:DGA1 [Candida jiufengensis]KAI5953173.1 DGA1 [Candida jiufengensis]